ncbi:hypothetical protein [Clostridium akagii]|uniref:hypothetical protein n=1 Tax=Clostridium akagii TaxID=91623 RepID=UPI000478A90B|nr:hypothetical protein [Clostridium akagii]
MGVNISEQLSIVMDKVKACSSSYADLKDSIIGENTFELLGDSVKVLALLNNSRKLYCLTKFKSFLEGINFETVSEENLQKLIEYVDNSEKAEFITSTFDKILSANSKIACSVIGLLVNEMCIKKRDVQQSDLMLTQALCIMNDFDVKNFVHLMDMRKWKEGSKFKAITNKTMKVFREKYNISELDLNLSLQVIGKGGLTEKEGEAKLDMDSDNPELSSVSYEETIYFNMLAKRLHMYAKKIVDQIEN